MSRDDTYLVDILESAKIAVDINQVWDTAQNKLPPLIAELSKIAPPE